MTDLNRLASSLRGFHRTGDPLVLVNAWDAASAQHVEAIGGRAIGTSSAAIAASLGIPDAPSAVDAIFEMVARIAAAVDVPVTADLLDGYGLEAEEIVKRLLATGAVGCNLEDSDHARPGHLVEATAVATMLADVRAAAQRAGVDIVINARIDTLLTAEANGSSDVDARTDIVSRAKLYIEAGADCVYPVRLVDPRLAKEIVDQVGAFVNANWAPNVSIPDLAAAGVHRISIGPQAHSVTLGALDEFAMQLLSTTERP